MKKWILIGLILVIGTSTIVMANNMYTIDNVIEIGSEEVEFKNDIYNIDGKTYVPIRELSEKLRIPIEWDEEKNRVELLTDYKFVHTPEKMTLKEEGVIPDEQTAYEIGKIILEKYAGRPLEYEKGNKIYYLSVRYQKEYNLWRVQQSIKYKVGGGGSSGVYVPGVTLNKNTGEVISINTYSEIE